MLPEDEKLDFRPSPDRPYLFGILAYEAKSKTGRSFEALEQGIVSLAVLSEALVDLGIPDAKPLVFTTIGDKWTLEAGILRGSPRDARLVSSESSATTGAFSDQTPGDARGCQWFMRDIGWMSRDSCKI